MASHLLQFRAAIIAAIFLLSLVMQMASCTPGSVVLPRKIAPVTDVSPVVLLPTEVDAIGEIEPVDKGSAVHDLILSNAESQQAWQEKKELFPSGGRWSTWLSQFTMSASKDATPPTGLIRLPPDQVSFGRLLIANVLNKPHKLALIFLLDYQPLLVQDLFDSQPAYYTPEIAVDEEVAFEFLFPPMSQGFHQLSILMITDPDLEPEDPMYRQALKLLFTEQRYDLWVGIDEIPPDVPVLLSRDQAIEAGGFLHSLDVLNPKRLDERPARLQLFSDTQTQLELCFWGNEEPDSRAQSRVDTQPVAIGVFWDDRLTGWVEYELDPLRRFRLPVVIKTPTTEGVHHLQVVVFQTPWYAQYDAEDERIAFGKATSSNRILVEVTADQTEYSGSE